MNSSTAKRYSVWVSTIVAVASLALLLSSTTVQGAPLDSETKVKVSVKVGKPNEKGKQSVTIDIQIESGWHLYANPVGLKGFAAVQTSLKLDKKAKATLVKVVYPEGKLHQDPIVGDYRIYENKVSLQTELKREKGDNSPLQLILHIQACNEGMCLLPSDIPVKVE